MFTVGVCLCSDWLDCLDLLVVCFKCLLTYWWVFMICLLVCFVCFYWFDLLDYTFECVLFMSNRFAYVKVCSFGLFATLLFGFNAIDGGLRD